MLKNMQMRQLKSCQEVLGGGGGGDNTRYILAIDASIKLKCSKSELSEEMHEEPNPISFYIFAERRKIKLSGCGGSTLTKIPCSLIV